MHTPRFGGILAYAFALTILNIITFGALHLLNMPAGRFIDWTIATVSLWWLLIVVTVLWDIYFDAKAVVNEAEQSQSAGISVDEAQLIYVKRVANSALIGAVVLHLASAAALFALSYYGISAVGYIGSAAALLLTFLRPSVRGYEYLRAKLQAMKNRFRYPREDVLELRNRTSSLENNVNALQKQLNLQDPDSFASRQHRLMEEMRMRQTAVLEELHRLDDANIRDHERIAHDSRNAIAKISADSQFLDHVREIVQMIKSA
ncbi:MAG: hypothetical protein KGS72_14900 [Cyanobacteria bacterium REEB67]|nr:hypothetical protein [Cyanobacteria bacterium REEB67]